MNVINGDNFIIEPMTYQHFERIISKITQPIHGGDCIKLSYSDGFFKHILFLTRPHVYDSGTLKIIDYDYYKYGDLKSNYIESIEIL